MKKRSRIALLTALLAIVFAAGISVYSNYIGMQIYQESSNHLLESYAQISKTFTAVCAAKLDRAEPVGQPDKECEGGCGC